MRLWLVGLAFLTLVLHHAACMMAAEGFGAVAPGDVPEGGGGGGGGADDDGGDGGGGGKKRRGLGISWKPYVLPIPAEEDDELDEEVDDEGRAELLVDIQPHDKKWMKRFCIAFGVHKQTSRGSSFTFNCKKAGCAYHMRLRQDEVSGNWYLEVTTCWHCATFGVIHMHCARSLLEMMKRDEDNTTKQFTAAMAMSVLRVAYLRNARNLQNCLSPKVGQRQKACNLSGIVVLRHIRALALSRLYRIAQS